MRYQSCGGLALPGGFGTQKHIPEGGKEERSAGDIHTYLRKQTWWADCH